MQLSGKDFYFNPLRPRGRRLHYNESNQYHNKISTHSAHEDGDTLRPIKLVLSMLFQPTPPTRTETYLRQYVDAQDDISTHSAHEDGDVLGHKILFYICISTHSAHEDGDLWNAIHFSNHLLFQPTPPTRTETTQKLTMQIPPLISTHSAHEDGDVFIMPPNDCSIISTHSAHEDGDKT